MYRIPRIQSTELKKVNKQKGPSGILQSHLGGRRKQSWSRGQRGDMCGREECEGKGGTESGMRARQERRPEGHQNEWKYATSGGCV